MPDPADTIEWEARDVDAPFGRLLAGALVAFLTLYVASILLSNPPNRPELLLRIPLSVALIVGLFLPLWTRRPYRITPLGPTRRGDTKAIPWPNIRRAKLSLGTVLLAKGAASPAAPASSSPATPPYAKRLSPASRSAGLDSSRASLRWETSDVEEPAERLRAAIAAALLAAGAFALVRATGKPEAAILLMSVGALASGLVLRSRVYWITPDGVTTRRSVRETIPWGEIRAAERRGRAVLLRTGARRHCLTLPHNPGLRHTALALLKARLPPDADL